MSIVVPVSCINGEQFEHLFGKTRWITLSHFDPAEFGKYIFPLALCRMKQFDGQSAFPSHLSQREQTRPNACDCKQGQQRGIIPEANSLIPIRPVKKNPRRARAGARYLNIIPSTASTPLSPYFPFNRWYRTNFTNSGIKRGRLHAVYVGKRAASNAWKKSVVYGVVADDNTSLDYFRA